MTQNQLRFAELQETKRHNEAAEALNTWSNQIHDYSAKTERINSATNALNAQTRIDELQQTKTDDYRDWSAKMTANQIEQQNVSSLTALREAQAIAEEYDAIYKDAQTYLVELQANKQQIDNLYAFEYWEQTINQLETYVEKLAQEGYLTKVQVERAKEELDRFEATDTWWTRMWNQISAMTSSVGEIIGVNGRYNLN